MFGFFQTACCTHQPYCQCPLLFVQSTQFLSKGPLYVLFEFASGKSCVLLCSMSFVLLYTMSYYVLLCPMSYVTSLVPFSRAAMSTLFINQFPHWYISHWILMPFRYQFVCLSQSDQGNPKSRPLGAIPIWTQPADMTPTNIPMCYYSVAQYQLTSTDKYHTS